ncbi:MAG: 2-oxoacid:acceptor oxidoreductase subunit alpha [Candidatus Micrarchaeia archaeon]
MTDVVWKIGGEAGYGIASIGLTFAKACARGGLHVFTDSGYPSRIRGGHNTFLVRVSERPVHAHSDRCDILVALDAQTIEENARELKPGGVLIYDGEKDGEAASKVGRADIELFNVPFIRIARELGVDVLMKNTITLGASMALLDYGVDIVAEMIRKTYGRKGAAIVDANIRSLNAGFDYAKKNYRGEFSKKLRRVKGAPRRMVLDGNAAISLAAVQAGCRFLAQYPMTPSSAILSNLAAIERKYNIVVKQTEDELAALNMAIGAGYAGVRALTATSGGGFSLMVEALGLAGSAEVPVVIVEGQRPGPSTGMPTWTEQGDLRFVIHASQGEFPRVVLAPGDVEECYYKTIEAFNLAEKYQVPVIILTDKFLAENYKTCEFFRTGREIRIERGKLLSDAEAARLGNEVKRFEFTEDGVSPRPIPGQPGGVHMVAGDEHNEFGEIDESELNRTRMMDKRMRKMEGILRELEPPKVLGSRHAMVTLVGWGSTKGIALDAIELLAEEGITANYIHFCNLWPFKAAEAKELLSSAKNLVLVENNKTGQLGGLIREQTGIEFKHRLLKYSGRQFFPSEIFHFVREVFGGG